MRQGGLAGLDAVVLVLLAEGFRRDRNVMVRRFEFVTPDANGRGIRQRVILAVRIQVDMIELNAVAERGIAALAGI